MPLGYISDRSRISQIGASSSGKIFAKNFMNKKKLDSSRFSRTHNIGNIATIANFVIPYRSIY